MKRLAALALLALPLAAACQPDTTMTYPAPCFGTGADACITWRTPNGNTIEGPAWAMTQGDTES